MSTSRATYLWKSFLFYPSKCRTNPFFETKSDGLWLVDDHSYTACTSSFIASAFIPHETTLRLFTPNLGCFGYFHPFLPYRQPFLPLSTRFTTVNIYCQLSSVTITYPKINYTSLTHFSPFSLILTHLTHFSIVFLRVFARPHASLTHYIRIWHITFISAHPSPFSTSFTRKQPFPVIFGQRHAFGTCSQLSTPTVDRSRLLPSVSSPTIHFLPIFVHFSLTFIFNTIYSFFNPFFYMFSWELSCFQSSAHTPNRFRLYDTCATYSQLILRVFLTISTIFNTFSPHRSATFLKYSFKCLWTILLTILQL